MKCGIVNFPGSNGFADTMYALRVILEQHVVELWHESQSLQNVDVVILPSGASFGDFPEAGANAAVSPIMAPVRKFAQNKGIVLGIGNGFQILCHAGLLPGSLLANRSGLFVAKNAFVRPDNTSSHITKLIGKDQLLQLPVAHYCGRYHADQETLRRLHQKNQILFRYCDKTGKTSSESNPDGSVDHIAAICNEQMNVFGIMACPERAVDPDLGNVDGTLIFQGLINAIGA